VTDSLLMALYETVREYGPSIFSTPKMFEIVIAQKAITTPKEVEALTAALHHGAVAELVNRPTGDPIALAASLAGRAGIPMHSAKWSVELWRTALRHVKDGVPPPSIDWESLKVVAPQPAGRFSRFAILSFVVVSLVGAIAGLAPGVLCAIGLTRDLPQAHRLRSLVEKHEVPGLHMGPREFGGWTGSLGAFGGALGAALGWLVGNHRPATWTRLLGGVIGALWAFDAAAFGMAYLGLTGAFIGPLFGATGAVAVAGWLGPFAVLLLLKPAAWGVFSHF
jgi:hypothetical protein